MDKELNNMIKRVKNDGIIITKPNYKHKKLILKTNYSLYTNYRKNETIIIDKNKILKILRENRK